MGGTGHLVKNHIEENAHLMRIIKRGSAELNIADGVVELESQPAFFCGTGSGSTQKRLKRQKYGKFGKPQTNLNFFLSALIFDEVGSSGTFTFLFYFMYLLFRDVTNNKALGHDLN